MIARRLHPAALLNRLQSTYWFLPALLSAGAFALAIGATTLDRLYPNSTAWMGWAYGGGADGARALLSAIAGSTITVVSVTFSVMVVALTVSSQHFGPRLLNNFMRDRVAQTVLGAFTGTFAYCLLVLRTVRGDGDDYAMFVPHLSVTIAVVIALLSVGMLIYYVHHVASSMRVSEITAAVTRDLEAAIDRLYPDRFGEGPEPAAVEVPQVPARAVHVRAESDGYVQEIDERAVMACAIENDVTVWLTARPGDFVTEQGRLVAVYPPPQDLDRVTRRLRGAYVFGTDRTARQDAAFAVQQLVEVALRALSPGVNEPFTATTCIDRLGQGLARLASRHIPSPARFDDQQQIRVVAYPQTFAALLEMAFEPIATYADRNRSVVQRLLATLTLLAGFTRRAADREAIARMADFVHSSAIGQMHDDAQRADLTRGRNTVLTAIADASQFRGDGGATGASAR